MNKTEILLFSFAMAFLAIRLYQKYVKKNNNKSKTDIKPTSGNILSSTSKDDDYEPYSKS